MPAACGCWTVSVTGCARGARDAGLGADWDGLGLNGERLCCFMMTATFVRVGRRQPTRAKRGTGTMQSPQRDQRNAGVRCESPMTGSPPLGPGYTTGTKRQLVFGHGLTSASLSYPRPDSSSRAVGGRARPEGYTGSGPAALPPLDGVPRLRVLFAADPRGPSVQRPPVAIGCSCQSRLGRLRRPPLSRYNSPSEMLPLTWAG